MINIFHKNHPVGSAKVSLEELLKILDMKIQDCPDISKRLVYLDEVNRGCFIYTEGYVDKNLLQRDFMAPLLEMPYKELLDAKKVSRLPCFGISLLYDTSEIITDILAGNAIFVCDGMDYAISCNMKMFDKRAIDEPAVEKNIRGPHEGFIESMDTNIVILRRKMKNDRLKLKKIDFDNMLGQTAAIAYVDGLANNALLNELETRIKGIDFDGLLAIGYLEQAITDFPNSLFPQYQATERPDKAIAALLEGRFVVMLDGTPVVLVTPVSFFSYFQALDDYSSSWIHGSFLRLLRITALIIAVFVPAFYVAVTSFHYYAVPLNLLIPLAESRAKVPIQPVIEVLILTITVELVREAAVRLPTYIGSTIGVVAGLIIGQAAVEAGIVSNLLIVIIGSTAIASYVTPSYDMSLAIRILSLIYVIAAGIFGIIGIIVCFSLTMAHLVTLESMGQPFFQPLAPFKPRDLKDVFLRLPLKFLRTRPSTAQPQDRKRGKNDDR